MVARGERVSHREWKEGEKEWSKEGHCKYRSEAIVV